MSYLYDPATPLRSAPVPVERPRGSRSVSLISVLTSSRVLTRVLGCLNDDDVMLRLALSGRLLRQLLMGYPVKRSVDPAFANLLTHQYRYIWLAVTRMHNVPMNLDMRRATSLAELKYDDISNIPIIASLMAPYLTHLTFGRAFNQYVKPGDIPHSVTHLTFGDSFNLILVPGAIPPYVTHLTFGACFNQLLTAGTLPDSIEVLEFGACYNQPIMVRLPFNLKRLKFGLMFNSLIHPGGIPLLLTHISFGECFRRPFLILPSITNLQFETVFSYYCDKHIIPSNVTHLQLGRLFDEVDNPALVKKCIPSSVTHLEISQPFAVGAIPSSVKHLTFGPRFETELIPGMIPDSVTHLRFNNLFDYPLDRNIIPPSVTHLSFKGPLHPRTHARAIPSSVTHLQLGYHICGRQPIIDAKCFPSSITHLLIHQPVKGFLPGSIKHIVFGLYYSTQITPRVIPSSVREVILDCELTDRMHPGAIPNGVTHLTFGDEWWPFISKGVIPETVTSLRFGRQVECSRNDVDSSYGQPIYISPDAIPKGLTAIEVSPLGPVHELWCDREFWGEKCSHKEVKLFE